MPGVGRVAGSGTIVYDPIGTTPVTFTAVARGRTSNSDQSLPVSVNPIGKDTALMARWPFEERTGPTATPVAWNTPTMPVISVPSRIGTVAGNGGGDDGALALTGQPGFTTASPVADTTTANGLSMAFKLQGGTGTGTVLSQTRTGGDAFTVDAVTVAGVRTYRFTVTTSAGSTSVDSAIEASTDPGTWDWIVASYQPPTPTTAGKVWLWTSPRSPELTPAFVSASADVPSATAVASTGGLQLGRTYAGVIDDLNVWTGTTTQSFRAPTRFAS